MSKNRKIKSSSTIARAGSGDGPSAEVVGIIALGASLFGLLRAGPSSPPIPIGLALLVPLLLAGLAYARSTRFRSLLLGADLRWLIGVQLWRVAELQVVLTRAASLLRR